ncbi:GNAT family N-acetyltransferase [uncultured Nitratireductor sp.]|uniref:GNAT family N-acetyltransferase n=1 Tax=uncultured Nitratireductor sp. TaxID=520953 RepID=UPI0025DE4E61|nr:GNAT family N-acetyltransferase [uncultured Nitratireductor sp.]
MPEITTAESFSGAELREAMVDAFSDYQIPLTLSQPAFDLMMKQRGLDRRHSRVAIVDGRVAAIWLMSLRDERAYLISSGTRPTFRGRGLAKTLAQNCIAALADIGVRSIQLEVLRDNEKAIRLYQSIGMQLRRRLDCYTVTARSGVRNDADMSSVPWQLIETEVANIRDWEPTWQNSDASMRAIAGVLHCVALRDQHGLSGYVIAETTTATLHQLAVRQDMRRRGVGRALIGTLLSRLNAPVLRLLNVQSDDQSFRGLMQCLDASETAGQYELKMDL